MSVLANVKQGEELAAAEDFRRQLQERSLQGGHPSVAERLRWLEENSHLLDQIERVSWGSASGTGLSPAEFKKMLAAVPLSSPHDEPFTHSIVSMLSQQVEDACRTLAIPLYSGVAYGSSAALEVSATKCGVPFADSSIVTISVGFLTFCSSISRMLCLALPHEPDGNRVKVSFAPEIVLAKLESDADLVGYWTAVLGAYAGGRGPLSVGYRLVPYPASYTRMQMLFSMERFSIAHEYGHHIFRHGTTSGLGVGGDPDALGNESEADLFALSLDRYIGMNDPSPNRFSASGAAAVALFRLHDCVKRIRQILLTGDDAIQPDGIHPPTSDRIAAFDALDHQFPYPNREHLRKMRLDVATVIDEMYLRLRPAYVKMHEQGVRPLSSQVFDPPSRLL